MWLGNTAVAVFKLCANSNRMPIRTLVHTVTSVSVGELQTWSL